MKNKIKKMLVELKAERKRLPQYSKFGDNNWEVLDKQIEILEKLFKEPTQEKLKELISAMEFEISEVEDTYPSDDDYDQMCEERKPYEETAELLEELIDKKG